MRLPYYLISIIWAALLFQGCNNNEETFPAPDLEPDGDELSLIQLSGDGIAAVDITRALDDFPNNRQIGVVAALYNNGAVDWTGYNDINNAPAIANDEVGGIFYFNFSPVKYWPFDGSELVFLGYSPAATGANGVTLENSRTVLDIELTASTPDVMYASNNTTAETTPYSKVGKPIVDLGEFEHALSRLTVRVQAGTNMNPNVRLDSLVVITTVTSATLDLLQGATGLTVNPAGSAPFEYELVTSSTAFGTPQGYQANVIMMPGSENDTQIYVKFSDGYFSVRDTFPVSAFANVTNPGNLITFEQGVNATLEFTVVGTLVQDPLESITLQGQLTDWNQRPDLGVTIN